MNKKLMMALTAFLLTFTAQGQTMRSLWIAMPDSLFPYLDRNAKTIMADGVGEGIATGNRLSGQSRIDTLTADYLKATLSEASYIEMKRIANPQGDSILAVVTTFCGPSIGRRCLRRSLHCSSRHHVRGPLYRVATENRAKNTFLSSFSRRYSPVFLLLPTHAIRSRQKAGKGHFAGEKIRFRGFILKRG